MLDDRYFFIIILLSILLLAIVFGLCTVIASMAQKRGRSTVGWVIFSLLTSPIISLILLLCLGETDERRINRLEEEALLFCRIMNDYSKAKSEVTESNKAEKQIVNSPETHKGISVNDMYKHSVSKY